MFALQIVAKPLQTFANALSNASFVDPLFSLKQNWALAHICWPLDTSVQSAFLSDSWASCLHIKHWILAVQEYSNCSCIGDVSTNTSGVSSSAVEGVCHVTSCYTWRLVIFFVIFFLAQIVIFVCEILHILSMLRWHSFSAVVPAGFATNICLQ